MAICSKCSSEVADFARFCPSCGAARAEACPSCGAATGGGARFCESCGCDLSARATGAEERKMVTVLFADVTGSTALGEQLDPERSRALLGTYFRAMSGVIEAWNGTVEKFIGDAVMAVFGVPTVREDDAERALRAALDMLDRLHDLNVDLEKAHGVTLQIRVGVNTGEVIAPLGAPPEQLIVTGDAVNVAARLQQAAEPGTVMAGEHTYQAARAAFDFEEPVLLELKGKSAPVAARRVVKPVAEAQRGIPGLRAPMIGRRRELGTLEGLLEDAIERSIPQLVTIYGPAGIGKSRLVLEFTALAAASRGATVLRGRCLAAGQGITYWALGEVLRQAAGIGLDEDAAVARDKLAAEAHRRMSGLRLSEDELRLSTAALAATAGLDLPDDPLAGLEPEAVVKEMRKAWPRFASSFAGASPTVLVIEDLHWAEGQLLDMLERIFVRSEGALVIVVTARPEFAQQHAGFGAGSDNYSSISLRPLDHRQSTELVESLLDLEDLPPRLKNEILDKAEGNPFFLEEMIRRLIDEGAIVEAGGRWRATGEAASVRLPDTVHALLAGRIDSLRPDEKRVLQEAAVVGRVFWEEPVRRSLPSVDVAKELFELERKGLVFARPDSSISGAAEYSFKHALVRDVAYSTLPKARRARAYADVGAWLEELTTGREEEFGELVAHFYHSAVADEDADLAWLQDPDAREAVRQKAFHALMAAGDAAHRRYALEKAVELHEQALRLAAPTAEEIQALERVGDDHATALHGDEAVGAFRRALDAARPLGETGDIARLCAKTVETMTWAGSFKGKLDPQWAEDLIAEGLSLATDDAQRAELLHLRAHAMSIWHAAGIVPAPDMPARRAAAEEALRRAKALDQVGLLNRAYDALWYLGISEGRFDEVVAVNEAHLELFDRLESDRDRAELLSGYAATLVMFTGDYDRGIDEAKRSLELARRVNAHSTMHSLCPLLEACFWRGRWEEADPFLREHLRAFADEADVGCSGVRGGPSLAALIWSRQGRMEEAERAFDAVREPYPLEDPCYKALHLVTQDPVAARELAQEAWDREREPMGKADAGLPLVEALVALEAWDALGDLLPEVHAISAGWVPLAGFLERAEGLLRRASGDTDEAVARLMAAVAMFDSLGLVHEAARTRVLLAEVVGEPEAERLRRSAIAGFERVGAVPDLRRLASDGASR